MTDGYNLLEVTQGTYNIYQDQGHERGSPKQNIDQLYLNTLETVIRDCRLLYKEKLISTFTFIIHVKVKVIEKVSLNVKVYRILKYFNVFLLVLNKNEQFDSQR